MRTRKTWNLFTLVAVVATITAPGAFGVVLNYEMSVAPDEEQVQMLKKGDGFGDRAAGDFKPPENAGLQGNGTARFSTTGKNGQDGYIIGGFGPYTVDMSIWAEEYVSWVDCARSLSFVDEDGYGRGIQLEPGNEGGNSLRLTFIKGASQPQVAIMELPKTSEEPGFRKFRLSVPGGQTNKAYVYDLENTDGGGNWVKLLTLPGGQQPPGEDFVGLGNSHFNLSIPHGGIALNSCDDNALAWTNNSKYLADWVRIDTQNALDETDPIIPAPEEQTCNSTFDPVVMQSVAVLGQAAPPIVCTVTNVGTTSNIDYTVAEVDADGNINDYTWLMLDKTSGSSIPPLATDTVTVSFDTSGFAEYGSHTAYLKYTDNCGNVYMRTVVLVITEECATAVIPSTGPQTSQAILGQPAEPDQFEYEVQNNGATEITYTVGEVDEIGGATDYEWLSLDKTLDTIAPITSDYVVASIDTGTITEVGVYDAYLKFTDDCSTPNEYMRHIQLSVVECRWEIYPPAPPALTVFQVGGLCVAPREVKWWLSNTGSVDLNYTITVENLNPDTGWVTVTQNASGLLLISEEVEFKISIDPDGIPTDSTFTLRIHSDCEGLADIVPPGKIIKVGMTPDPWAYQGDVDPTAVDSAGTGLNFGIYRTAAGSVAQGEVAVDNDAMDGYAWHIDDAIDKQTMYRTLPNSGNINMAIQGYTLVSRIKTKSKGGSATGNLFTWNKNQGLSSDIHWGGADGLIAAIRRGDHTQLIEGNDDKYHIIRITSWGGTRNALGAWGNARIARVITVYFDEDPTPVLQIWDASPVGSAAEDGFDWNGSGFGVGSYNYIESTQDISFDWFTATHAGPFGPGEEEPCFGWSLNLSACHEPFADADDDGDVDQDDFAKFQRCFTGDDDPQNVYDANCKCFDQDDTDDTVPDIDSNDFNMFQNCATGPGVPWSQELTPECNP